MKPLAYLLAAGCLAAATARAETGAVFNASVVSDYVWRGVSQTPEWDAVVQGGAAWYDRSGFYVGAWASPVDRTLVPVAADVDARLDLFAGFQVATAIGLAWDFGVIAYLFDENEANFEEVYLGASFGPLRGKVAHDWGNDNTYSEAGYVFDLGSGFALDLFGGYYAGDMVDNYLNYGAGVTAKVDSWELGLRVSDTDIDPSNEAVDTNTVISIKKRW